jgi:hypothetical protein
LIFQTNDGQQVPCSAEWVTLELIGDAASLVDPELIRHASVAVLHYFKHELNRQFVSVAEFAAVLERALHAVGLSVFAEAEPSCARVQDSHLPELMKSSGENGELFFFPQLRQELQRRLEESPQIVRFNGLRPCVKQLAGADRWSPRCENLSDQIVDYLRTCWQSDTRNHNCTLVVK